MPPSRCGLSAILVAITMALPPHGGHTTGWQNPVVHALLACGIGLLIVFVVIESKVADPMIQLSLFRIRAFAAGNAAVLCLLPGAGRTPVHADHLVAGHLVAAARLRLRRHPAVGGHLPAATDGRASWSRDRCRARCRTASARAASRRPGCCCSASTFVGLLLLPIDFPYWAFAVLIAANGIGSGMFAAPNTSSIMSSVPAGQRGVASGMRSTFQNSGTALSIGVFFSLMIVGLSTRLPHAMSSRSAAAGRRVRRSPTRWPDCRRFRRSSRPCSGSTHSSTCWRRPER